jgi:hypothetical protein
MLSDYLANSLATKVSGGLVSGGIRHSDFVLCPSS